MSIYKEKFNKQLVIRGLTSKTKSGYTQSLELFLRYFKGKRPSDLTVENVHDYLFHLRDEKKQSPSYINSQTGSIKFFCKHVLNKDWEYSAIPYTKVGRKLPYVHKRETVSRLVHLQKDLRIRCIFGLAYGSGARPFELAKLKPGDICAKSGTIYIRNGKGGKDRYTNLPEGLIGDLREYYTTIRSIKSEWLFPGANPQNSIDPESFGAIYRRVKKQMNLNDPSCFYTFRHSFATHLMEDGADIRTISEVMGHSSVEQTMRYILVTKKRIGSIRSPFDTLPKVGDLC